MKILPKTLITKLKKSVGNSAVKFVKAYIEEPVGILLKVAKKCKSENLEFYFPYGALMSTFGNCAFDCQKP
jgi:hypothetical protein